MQRPACENTRLENSKVRSQPLNFPPNPIFCIQSHIDIRGSAIRGSLVFAVHKMRPASSIRGGWGSTIFMTCFYIRGPVLCVFTVFRGRIHGFSDLLSTFAALCFVYSRFFEDVFTDSRTCFYIRGPVLCIYTVFLRTYSQILCPAFFIYGPVLCVFAVFHGIFNFPL